MSTARISWADRIKVRKVSEGGSEADPEAEHESGEAMERPNSSAKADSEAGSHEDTGVAASFEAQAIEEENATRDKSLAECENATAGTSSSSRNPNANGPTCEAIDLHWLLKTANPYWTAKELASAKDKLNQAEIISFDDLEEALQGKSVLNNRLRDHGFKAFGSSTLERLRNAVVSERERQRTQNLLLVQRERRRLDQESKVCMEAPTRSEPQTRTELPARSSMGSDAGAEDVDSIKRELHQPNDCRDSTVLEAAVCRTPPVAAVPAPVDDGNAGLQTTKESISVAAVEDDAPSSHDEVLGDNLASVSGQFPSPFVASSQFRRGLSDRLACGHSWEWPLTREEKKERVRMLDLEVLASYGKEISELKAKLAKVDAQGQKDPIDSEDGGEGSSESGLTTTPRETFDSELGIDIAG